METEQLSLHLQLEVVLRRLPLRTATGQQKIPTLEKKCTYVLQAVLNIVHCCRLRSKTPRAILERIVQAEAVSRVLGRCSLGAVRGYDTEGIL